jgi:lambda family phage portal protein
MPRPASRRPRTLGQRLDALVAAAAKRLGFTRTAVAQAAVRNAYQAATVNRLSRDWLPTDRSSDADTLQDLRMVRKRARELARNDPYGKHFVNLCAQNIVGPRGIRPLPKVLRADGEADKEARAELRRAWGEFLRPANFSLDRRWSGITVQQLLARSWPQDGEILLREVRGAPNAFGYALQPLDPDQLDLEYNRPPSKAHREIRMGIEIDAVGTPVLYHLWPHHPNDLWGRRGPRIVVPADEIIHTFLPFRAGMTRGVPWFAASAWLLHNLHTYADNELTASRIAAAKMGFMQLDPELVGDFIAPEVKPEDEEGDREPRLQMEAEPGLIEQLPPGYKFQDWDPSHPVDAFEDFCKMVLHGIAVGFEVSYQSLTGDLSETSYSSDRAGQLRERDIWLLLQGHLATYVLDRVWAGFTKYGLLTGAIQLPARDLARYQQVAWLGRGWPWVDPKKDMEADATAVHQGLNSRTRVLADQGLDIEDVFAELAEEEELAAEYGLTLPTALNSSTTGATHEAGTAAGDDGGSAAGAQRADRPRRRHLRAVGR